uniref:WGS project CBMI000000000 data, contig CS3069_c004210 n=1 Tax=Fusarium clavum TaxID=2594811 RepID=A0A090MIH6_9HYPO|nr:unnamed protein product [Fusarium clavum]
MTNDIALSTPQQTSLLSSRGQYQVTAELEKPCSLAARYVRARSTSGRSESIHGPFRVPRDWARPSQPLDLTRCTPFAANRKLFSPIECHSRSPNSAKMGSGSGMVEQPEVCFPVPEAQLVKARNASFALPVDQSEDERYQGPGHGISILTHHP